MLAVNQYGIHQYIPGVHPRKELLAKLGGGRADKIYRDKKDGAFVCVGYIIRGEWWALYTEYEVKQ